MRNGNTEPMQFTLFQGKMTELYKLKFHCCGSEVSIGTDRNVGKHADYCLSCDTENPETEVFTETR